MYPRCLECRKIGAGFATVSGAHETLLDLLAEGNKVAARHQFSGTQFGALGSYPPSGKVLVTNYLAILFSGVC